MKNMLGYPTSAEYFTSLQAWQIHSHNFNCKIFKGNQQADNVDSGLHFLFFPLCLRVLALQDTLIFKERLTHHFAPITHVTALK